MNTTLFDTLQAASHANSDEAATNAVPLLVPPESRAPAWFAAIAAELKKCAERGLSCHALDILRVDSTSGHIGPYLACRSGYDAYYSGNGCFVCHGAKGECSCDDNVEYRRNSPTSPNGMIALPTSPPGLFSWVMKSHDAMNRLPYAAATIARARRTKLALDALQKLADLWNAAPDHANILCTINRTDMSRSTHEVGLRFDWTGTESPAEAELRRDVRKRHADWLDAQNRLDRVVKARHHPQ